MKATHRGVMVQKHLRLVLMKRDRIIEHIGSAYPNTLCEHCPCIQEICPVSFCTARALAGICYHTDVSGKYLQRSELGESSVTADVIYLLFDRFTSYIEKNTVCISVRYSRRLLYYLATSLSFSAVILTKCLNFSVVEV